MTTLKYYAPVIIFYTIFLLAAGSFIGYAVNNMPEENKIPVRVSAQTLEIDAALNAASY